MSDLTREQILSAVESFRPIWERILERCSNGYTDVAYDLNELFAIGRESSLWSLEEGGAHKSIPLGQVFPELLDPLLIETVCYLRAVMNKDVECPTMPKVALWRNLSGPSGYRVGRMTPLFWLVGGASGNLGSAHIDDPDAITALNAHLTAEGWYIATQEETDAIIGVGGLVWSTKESI